MSWLSNAFGGNKNPNTEANNYLNQIPGQVKPYYDPYINAGKDSLDKLTKHYGDLTDNPGKVFGDLGAAYTQSPGYAATLREALSGANNAAALGGGGGLGTYGHQELAAGAAGDVANKDFEQYINHVLGLHTEGLQGEQGIENQGFSANKDYASMIAQLLNAQGTNAANTASAHNQQTGNNWSNLFSTLSSVAPWAANHFFPNQPEQGV